MKICLRILWSALTLIALYGCGDDGGGSSVVVRVNSIFEGLQISIIDGNGR